MAATHTSGTILASVSNAAGGTQTSSAINNATGYGAIVTAIVTNGGTSPTVGCTATLQVSSDGTTWHWAGQQTAGVAASGVYPMLFDVSMHAIQARVTFSGNTGQAVTVEAQYQQTATI